MAARAALDVCPEALEWDGVCLKHDVLVMAGLDPAIQRAATWMAGLMVSLSNPQARP